MQLLLCRCIINKKKFKHYEERRSSVREEELFKSSAYMKSHMGPSRLLD
jgi:hypothetical protein